MKSVKAKEMAEFVRNSALESVVGEVDGCEEGEVCYVWGESACD